MKLSELRPCDNCGGKIIPTFMVLRISHALFKPQAMNEVLGMTQYFQGHLELAEMFVGDESVVLVTGDEDKQLMTELFICQDCYMMKPLDIAQLVEKRHDALQKSDTEDEG